MGIFSFNQGSYYSAGKGVQKDEPTLIRPLLFFVEFFGKYGKILKTTLLYLLCCIPVITVGPATAGYVQVLKTLEAGQPVFAASDFFEHLKKNWLQGFLMMLVNLVFGYSVFLVVANFHVLPQLQNFLIPLGVVAAFLLIMNFYIWPMMVSYDLPFFALLKNSFLLTMIRLPVNLLVAVLFLAVVALFALLAYLLAALLCAGSGMTTIDFQVFRIMLLLVFGFIGVAFPAFLAVYGVMPTLRKYMED